MARDYTAANNDVTSWSSGLALNGVDYSIHFWAYCEGSSNVGYMMAKWDSGVGFLLRRRAGQPDAMDYFHDNTTILTTSTSAVVQDAWASYCGVWGNAGGDIEVFVNNSSVGSATGQTGMSSAAAIALHAGNRPDLLRDFEGRLADFAIWSGHQLTAAQRAMLAAGVSPLAIRPLPDFYAPMIRDSSDVIGGLATASDTSDYVAHPPLQMVWPVTAVPTGTLPAASGGMQLVGGAGLVG